CLSFACANFRVEVCFSKNRHKPIRKKRCHTLKCRNHNDKYG
ncbi:tRNA (guanine(26)-N(2))-dimethyltransferase, partial [Trichinella spiralis]